MSAVPSPQASSQFELAPGVVADARRAVWLADHRALLVADVHLGHLWVERQRGTLLPIVPDDTLDRLQVLQAEFQPARWVFLGDTVHATSRPDIVVDELRQLLAALEVRSEVLFVLGNHDRQLPELLRAARRAAPCTETRRIGPHVLVHGDSQDWPRLEPPDPGGWVFHGHQHPAIVLGDGVATAVKVPCFLVSPRRVVLPAFSRWAAGVPWNATPPLSPLAATDPPTLAVAILGPRLLPVPLSETAAR